MPGMARAEDVTTFADHAPPPGEGPWVGPGPDAAVAIVAADPDWPALYRRIAATVSAALGDRLLAIEHVGSTAVADLPAKPVIDIDLTVADSADEAAYLPALEAIGFVLTVREPWWYEHRCLRREGPRANLHVFSPGCPELERHRIFRDWLATHSEDRRLYARTKLSASEAARADAGPETG
jgi:GrpB-like predicted nucleotidyltransferase (UPF0157 family)